MRCKSLKTLLLGGACLATAACASSEEWAEWRAHPAHFASTQHFQFSMRNRLAPPLVQHPADVELARAQGWWGGPFEEPPLANVAGRWTGTWSGSGVYHWPFSSHAEAEFLQEGRYGAGRLVLADTLTMDVPPILSIEGLRGVRVVLEVSGATLVVRHAADRRWLTGEFTVDGDRMVGRLRDSSARLVLVRRR
jgi:hypothetical protein